MVRIDITYAGGLRCEGVHGPSGQRLLTDAPVDNHGKGESFSPTDLVATALGSCMATIMGIVAEEEGIDLTGMRISVIKDMVSVPARRIGQLSVRIEMPCPVSGEQRKKLEAAARACPVKMSLSPDVQTPVEFVYP